MPNLSAIKLNDYFFRFIKSITPLVELVEFIAKVINFEDPKLSMLVGLLATVFIYSIELAPVYLPLIFVLYLLFNLYYKREYKAREREVFKNMRLIQRTMG